MIPAFPYCKDPDREEFYRCRRMLDMRLAVIAKAEHEAEMLKARMAVAKHRCQSKGLHISKRKWG